MRALAARGLGKRFRVRDPDAPRTFRRYVEEGWRRRPREEFWGLRGVSFELAAGEMLGVIGRNGAGKSTLLRLLGGVMRPDEGSVETEAPVMGLLDLNAGMHPDLSGRQNAVISGVVQGLLRREVERRLDEIFAFAELEASADAPFRTYSSGMKLRLGFAVAAHAEPRILLIDEVLAVGDLAFQAKCLDRVRRVRDEGCAVVLISHDLSQVEALCNRALWLDAGRARALGSVNVVAEAYRSEMMAETARRAPSDAPEATTEQGVMLRMGENRHGSLEIEIASVRLIDAGGRDVKEIAPGAALTVELTLRARREPQAAHLGVAIWREDGTLCIELNTDLRGEAIRVDGGLDSALILERVDLAPGRYRLSVGAWRADWGHAFDYHDRAYELLISGATLSKGLILPPYQWRSVG
ncbi:MAG: ABC transporter ATP-binding protein [Hyphomonadaceae bacterium]